MLAEFLGCTSKVALNSKPDVSRGMHKREASFTHHPSWHLERVRVNPNPRLTLRFPWPHPCVQGFRAVFEEAWMQKGYPLGPCCGSVPRPSLISGSLEGRAVLTLSDTRPLDLNRVASSPWGGRYSCSRCWDQTSKPCGLSVARGLPR